MKEVVGAKDDEDEEQRFDDFFDQVVIPARDTARSPKISIGKDNATALAKSQECSGNSWTVRILDADRKVVVVGGGPAGLSAAVYAARADLSPLVIARDGGQLESTTQIDNYPGFEDGVDAVGYIQSLERQALKFGAEMKACGVVSVDLDCRPFKITCEDGDVVTSSSLILATGASPRWLGVPGENDFLAKGIHTCATCDGFFYRGKHVAVVGGGDTAMEQALFLARICERVTLIHRGNSFRASKAMATRVLKHPKILILWNTVVSSFLPSQQDGDVLGAVQLLTGDKATTIVSVDAAFVSIGHDPNSHLFDIKKDPQGYAYTVPGSTRTSVAGVYAAGDVADPIYRQAITSAGTGAMAAIDAERWLCEHGC